MRYLVPGTRCIRSANLLHIFVCIVPSGCRTVLTQAAASPLARPFFKPSVALGQRYGRLEERSRKRARGSLRRDRSTTAWHEQDRAAVQHRQKKGLPRAAVALAPPPPSHPPPAPGDALKYVLASIGCVRLRFSAVYS